MKNPTCETCPYWDEHADAFLALLKKGDTNV
jgi:hypothetical protein